MLKTVYVDDELSGLCIMTTLSCQINKEAVHKYRNAREDFLSTLLESIYNSEKMMMDHLTEQIEEMGQTLGYEA